MSGRYLVDLADVLYGVGLDVVEYSGWKTRARSSGGFTGDRPWAIAWHHTASTASIESDAAYCAEGSPDAPVCNLLVARDGQVWLIAAGASNTNGKGYAMAFTRGTVPDDQMNTHAVGIEICNDGVGEVYPAAQVSAAFAVSLAIAAAEGLDPTDVTTHAAWAPDRKIDPATAFAVDPASGFHPGAVNSSGTWALDDLRAELAARAGYPPLVPTHPGTPAPPVSEGENSMIVALDENGTAWIGDGMTRTNPTEAVFANLVVLGKKGALRFVNVNGDGVSGWGDVLAVGADMVDALGRPVG
jgi:hypothetical protein